MASKEKILIADQEDFDLVKQAVYCYEQFILEKCSRIEEIEPRTPKEAKEIARLQQKAKRLKQLEKRINRKP